jgi:hypothetical protein
VVLVSVSDDDATDFFLPLKKIADVWNDEVNAEHLGVIGS